MVRHEKKTRRGAGVSGRRVAGLAGTEPGRSERYFWRILAGICFVGLLCRLAILSRYLTENPLAEAPINDAKTYWDWAGRIAGGELTQDVPFFSAPLYPYLLGLMRRLGGTLTTLYAIQMLMDLATACILAFAARRRFGAKIGLLAGTLFLVMLDPASFSLRVLTCSLQLLLLALAYYQLVSVQAKPSISRLLVTGVTIGVLCLSYPPAMMLALVVGPWLFWQSGRRLGDALRAGIPLAVAAICIAPATIHNYSVSGNVFFIQSVTAVNLRQGNQVASTGGYTRIPNTTRGRERLFDDVAEQYALATGRDGSWAEINRWYRDQVLDFWRSDPARAAMLAARKLYYFLTAWHYADIYQPTAEIKHDVNRLLLLAPLPTPWLIGPALVGMAIMLRRPVRHLPEWILFALPLLVVVVFWYTPRYRLPGIPVIAVVAAWGIGQALDWRMHWRRTVLVTSAFAVSLALSAANWAAGFDRHDPAALSFHLAYALNHQGKTSEAIEQQREGLGQRPNDAAGRAFLGDLLTETGQLEDALAEYRLASELNPNDAGLLRRIGQTLFQLRRFAEAEAVLYEANKANPADVKVLSTLAASIQLQGRRDEACGFYEMALGLAPEDTLIRATYGDLLMRLQRWEEARAVFEQIARASPEHFDAQYKLGIVCGESGDLQRAVSCFESALQIRPQSVQALHALGIVNVKRGRLEEAASCFRRALAIAPHDEKCLKALEHVERLRAADPAGTP